LGAPVGEAPGLKAIRGRKKEEGATRAEPTLRAPRADVSPSGVKGKPSVGPSPFSPGPAASDDA